MMNHPYRISIIGPQASGKGTQGELLALYLGIPEISMGQMLRDEVKKGTDRGKEIDTIIGAGHLVPVEVTMDLLQDRTSDLDAAKGFIIDGFPRNIGQYHAYKVVGGPTHVVALGLSDDMAVERLAGRLVCSCGEVFHEKYNPPKNPNVCDKCGGVLKRRHDDTPEIIRERLEVFHTETEPLYEEYEKEGILYRVDASSSIQEVHAAVVKSLGI